MRLGKLLRPVFNLYSSIAGFLAKYCPQIFIFVPLRMTIYITKKCNLTCPMCYTKDALNTPEPNALTLDEWKKIIDSTSRNTVLDFCGGEIFFSPLTLPLLEYITKKKRLVSIITNGTTVTEEMIDKFIKQKVTYYMTSIDGMEHYHDQIRGMKGTFKRATDMIRYMQKRKKETGSKFPITCLKVIITPENYLDLPRLLEFAEHDLKVDNVQFSLIYDNKHRMVFETFKDYTQIESFKGNTFNYPKETREEVKNAIRKIIEYKKKSDMYIGLDPRLPKDEHLLDYIDRQEDFGVKNCNRHHSECFIHYDGQLASCISYDLGNIRDHDYNAKKIFKKKEVRNYLNHLDSLMPYVDECRSCCKADHQKID